MLDGTLKEFFGRVLGRPYFLRHWCFRFLSGIFFAAVVLQYSGILLLTQRYTVSRLYDVMDMVGTVHDDIANNDTSHQLSKSDVTRPELAAAIGQNVVQDMPARRRLVYKKTRDGEGREEEADDDNTGEVRSRLLTGLSHRRHYPYYKAKSRPVYKIEESDQDHALRTSSREQGWGNQQRQKERLEINSDSARSESEHTALEEVETSQSELQHLISRTSGPSSTTQSTFWRLLNYIKHGILPQTATTTPRPLLPCPKQPSGLDGAVPVLFTAPDWEILEAAHPEVGPGGHWTPPNCTARHHIGLVIPYRDRDAHLRVFLQHIHPFLQRQLLDYTIYVVDQTEGEDFNRAMLMNIGFAEAEKLKHHDCFVFHDVDLLPEIAQNMYSCPHLPRHMSAAVDSLGYRLPYQGIFGGVSALRTEHFRRVNGFSNCFFGWGGEDDDMYNRIKHHGLDITRYPMHIARYRMLSHKKEMPSHDRFTMLNSGALRYDTDGISSLVYDRKLVEKRPLYTLIRVQLIKEDVIKRSRGDNMELQSILEQNASQVGRKENNKNVPGGLKDYAKEDPNDSDAVQYDSQEDINNEIPRNPNEQIVYRVNNKPHNTKPSKQTRGGEFQEVGNDFRPDEPLRPRNNAGLRGFVNNNSVGKRLDRLLRANNAINREQEEREAREEQDNKLSNSVGDHLTKTMSKSRRSGQVYSSKYYSHKVAKLKRPHINSRRNYKAINLRES